MSGDSLRLMLVMEALGWNATLAARQFDVSPRQIKRWTDEGAPIPQAVDEWCQEVLMFLNFHPVPSGRVRKSRGGTDRL